MDALRPFIVDQEVTAFTTRIIQSLTALIPTGRPAIIRLARSILRDVVAIDQRLTA